MKEQTYSDLMAKASEYRGSIINETIYLEKTIDTYIATYFCDDALRMKEMHLLFLGDNRITFENKKQIFDYLAKKHDLEWYKSYQTIRNIKLKKESVALNNDLDYVIQQRNVLAHCFLDSTPPAKNRQDGVISFIRFKNDRSPFDFTQEIYLELHQMLLNMSNYILKRLDWLSKSPSNPFLVDKD